jgi:hypothetical protein
MRCPRVILPGTYALVIAENRAGTTAWLAIVEGL